MRSRAFRRAQKARVLKKWRTIGMRWHIARRNGKFDFEWFEKWLYRTAENMPTCSNPWCCGNPRKLGHLSWQEQRAVVSEREQVNEIKSFS
jgi:hypothetical protein